MADDARTGIILAAGFGSRLQGVTDDTALKPLTQVAGTPLLLRTLQSLQRAGCARIVVVTGHGAADIEGFVRQAWTGAAEIVFALNERYDLANGVSVLTAKPHLLGDTFVLTMADHILGDELMDLAREHTPPDAGATLLVDYKLASIFDMDDATKVYAEDGRIARIGKQIEGYNCVDCGVFVCTTALMGHLQQVFDARGDTSLSDGVQALASAGRMHVLDIGDGFWQDVDTPEMLGHAEAVLLERGA